MSTGVFRPAWRCANEPTIPGPATVPGPQIILLFSCILVCVFIENSALLGWAVHGLPYVTSPGQGIVPFGPSEEIGEPWGILGDLRGQRRFLNRILIFGMAGGGRGGKETVGWIPQTDVSVTLCVIHMPMGWTLFSLLKT